MASMDELKYPSWQTDVLLALTELDKREKQAKLARAESVISRRMKILEELGRTDTEEFRVLCDAKGLIQNLTRQG